MEDLPTLQGPKKSTIGLEVISPSVTKTETTLSTWEKCFNGVFFCSLLKIHPKFFI